METIGRFKFSAFWGELQIDSSNMKIIDLFRKHSFEEIKPSFNQLFAVNSGYQLTNEACLKWAAIYERWANSTPIGSVFHVYLAFRWEFCSPNVDMNCTVCDQENNILHPLAMHENNEEALGMDVVVEDDVDINELDLTAGLFWEMTYYPFSGEG